MTESKDVRYTRALSLAEGALEEYVRGDVAKGDKLAAQAVKTDRDAVTDVVRRLEQNSQENSNLRHLPTDVPN